MSGNGHGVYQAIMTLYIDASSINVDATKTMVGSQAIEAFAAGIDLSKSNLD